MANRRPRGVAQPGSAPALGAGGRRFKSGRPDHTYKTSDFGLPTGLPIVAHRISLTSRPDRVDATHGLGPARREEYPVHSVSRAPAATVAESRVSGEGVARTPGVVALEAAGSNPVIHRNHIVRGGFGSPSGAAPGLHQQGRAIWARCGAARRRFAARLPCPTRPRRTPILRRPEASPLAAGRGKVLRR